MTTTSETTVTKTTFPAGERAAIDLRDSSGAVTLKDGEPGTIVITADGDGAPFVLQQGDTFRIRLAGGTIAVPAGLPVEVTVPATVQLRVDRDGREADTIIRPAAGAASESAGSAAGSTGGRAPAGGPFAVDDLDQFARTISEGAQRIFGEMTRAV